MPASLLLAFSVSLTNLGQVLNVATNIAGEHLDSPTDYTVFTGRMCKASAIATYGVIDGWCERVIATTRVSERTESKNAVCSALGPLDTPESRDWTGETDNALVANPRAIEHVRNCAVDISRGISDGRGGCTWLMPWSLGVPEVDWTSDTNAFYSAELWNGRLVRTSDIARRNAFGAAKDMVRSPFYIRDTIRSYESLGWGEYANYNTYLYSVWGADFWDEDGRDEIEQDGRLDPYAFLYARPVIALMGKALVEPPSVTVEHHETTWFNYDERDSDTLRNPLTLYFTEEEPKNLVVLTPSDFGASVSTNKITTNVVKRITYEDNSSIARAKTNSDGLAYVTFRLFFRFDGFADDIYDFGNCIIMEDPHLKDYATPGSAKIVSMYEENYGETQYNSPMIADGTFEPVGTNGLYRISWDTSDWGEALQCQVKCSVSAECRLHAEIMREANTTTAEGFGIDADSVLPQVTDIVPTRESLEVFSMRESTHTNTFARMREIELDPSDPVAVTNVIVKTVEEDVNRIKNEMEDVCGGLGYDMIPIGSGVASEIYQQATRELGGKPAQITYQEWPEMVVEKEWFAPVALYIRTDETSPLFKRVDLGDPIVFMSGEIMMTNDISVIERSFTEHSYTGRTETVMRQMMDFDWKNYKGVK